jgi:hypothetical protein
MPVPLAILCSILFLALIYCEGGIIFIISLVFIPLYYAVRNTAMEIKKTGRWVIRWDKFFQVAVAEFVVSIIVVLSAGEEPAVIPMWVAACLLYILSTSLGISIAKTQAARLM